MKKSYRRYNDMKVKYEWLKFGHIGRMERTVDAGPWVKHRVWSQVSRV